MREKAWGNEYRATTVCVDGYQNGVMVGRFFNPYLGAGESFASLTQLLIKVDQVLDNMSFPQSFSKIRRFGDAPPRAGTPPETEHPAGKLATFSVKVLFRQNASWQGSVVWQEGGREESFRSVLELIFLMDSVLSEKANEAE